MILPHTHSPSARRRSAFTLLEVLVVVAIILVLASVATVAVLQIREDNKNDTAKMNAVNLEKTVKLYILKHPDEPQPQNLQEVLKYVDGNDPAKLIDPWGQQYQIGYQDNGTGVQNPYVFTHNPQTGEEIRSDTKK
jgi:general secretion pathway protein G